VFATGGATDLLLACADRQLVLIDVRPRGKRVLLSGVAGPRHRGKRIAIVFQATGKVVARPLVSADGTFRATVKAPKGRLARSNRARYVARAGSERSLALKLHRMMPSVSLTRSGDRLTFSGTITGPRSRGRRVVRVSRLVSCGHYQTVGSATVGRDGHYRVRLAVPVGARAAIYRATAPIGSRSGGRTYTLPTAIDLR